MQFLSMFLAVVVAVFYYHGIPAEAVALDDAGIQVATCTVTEEEALDGEDRWGIEGATSFVQVGPATIVKRRAPQNQTSTTSTNLTSVQEGTPALEVTGDGGVVPFVAARSSSASSAAWLAVNASEADTGVAKAGSPRHGQPDFVGEVPSVGIYGYDPVGDGGDAKGDNFQTEDGGLAYAAAEVKHTQKHSPIPFCAWIVIWVAVIVIFAALMIRGTNYLNEGGSCPGGCGYSVSWHSTHCCQGCLENGPGCHEPGCVGHRTDPWRKGRQDKRMLEQMAKAVGGTIVRRATALHRCVAADGHEAAVREARSAYEQLPTWSTAPTDFKRQVREMLAASIDLTKELDIVLKEGQRLCVREAALCAIFDDREHAEREAKPSAKTRSKPKLLGKVPAATAEVNQTRSSVGQSEPVPTDERRSRAERSHVEDAMESQGAQCEECQGDGDAA